MMGSTGAFIWRMWQGRRSFERKRSRNGGQRMQRRGGRRLGLTRSSVPNTELVDKDPRWFEYNFLTSEESIDKEQQ
jgi:hypothetical protein